MNNSGKLGMRLGIGSYTFMWSIGFSGAVPDCRMSADDLLRVAHDRRISVVQYGPNLPLDGLSFAEFDRLIDQAREWGISLEIATRGTDATHLKSQLKLARRAGSNLIRCTAEPGNGKAMTSAELEKDLRTVLPQLEPCGVRLAIENSRMPARELAGVVERIGSPRIGITLDTVNSLAIAEGTHEVIEVLAPHVLCVHIKDFEIKRHWHSMGFIVEGAPAGRGQLNVSCLLQALRQAGAAPVSAILELWPPEQENLQATITLEHEWAEESLRFLRDYIQD